MNPRLFFGLGAPLAGLLIWNTTTLQDLSARLAALESAQESAKTDSAATAASARRTSANASTRPATRLAMDRTAGDPSTAAQGADGRLEADPATLLGLDDPDAREAFDSYLEAFLEARDEDRSYDEESNYLDHLSTTVQLYSEESGLSGEVQEQIVQRLETAHENWTAADAALKADEIDHREMVERHGRIEEAVTSEMTALLGEEAWEELAERIW